jgi:hypothetical protein
MVQRVGERRREASGGREQGSEEQCVVGWLALSDTPDRRWRNSVC